MLSWAWKITFSRRKTCPREPPQALGIVRICTCTSFDCIFSLMQLNKFYIQFSFAVLLEGTIPTELLLLSAEWSVQLSMIDWITVYETCVAVNCITISQNHFCHLFHFNSIALLYLQDSKLCVAKWKYDLDLAMGFGCCSRMLWFIKLDCLTLYVGNFVTLTHKALTSYDKMRINRDSLRVCQKNLSSLSDTLFRHHSWTIMVDLSLKLWRRPQRISAKFDNFFLRA